MNLLVEASPKTAIHRRNASFPARFCCGETGSSHLFDLLLGRPMRLLDFGAGHGKDVEYFRGYGFDAYGFDPLQERFNKMPTGKFDVVTCTYVLCVIPSLEQRGEILRQAWGKIKLGGILVVSVRTRREVSLRAKEGGWIEFGDGWITSKGTFQKGFTEYEFFGMLKNLGKGACGATVHVLHRSKALVAVVFRER